MARTQSTPDLFSGLPDAVQRCTKCGIVKPRGEFYKATATRRGRCTQCKTCLREHYYKYYAENGDAIRAMSKGYRDAHKEHYRQYEAAKRPLRAKQARTRRRKNTAQHYVAAKAWRQRIKLEILAHYSGGTPRCACCGETTVDFLTMDHVYNDGAVHRKVTGGGSLYAWIHARHNPPGFQVLCFNCNLAKGHYGSCPHQRTRVSTASDS